LQSFSLLLLLYFLKI